MIVKPEFDPIFASRFSETFRILESSNLVIHPQVYRISLHGSRGLAGLALPDSDIDICLHLDITQAGTEYELERLLREVLNISIGNWRGPIDLDLAVVYALREGGLEFFEKDFYDAERFPATACGYFALFKVQKGFNGYVDGNGVLLEKMYPCMLIWQNQIG
jgi:hypothetical protein